MSDFTKSDNALLMKREDGDILVIMWNGAVPLCNLLSLDPYITQEMRETKIQMYGEIRLTSSEEHGMSVITDEKITLEVPTEHLQVIFHRSMYASDLSCALEMYETLSDTLEVPLEEQDVYQDHLENVNELKEQKLRKAEVHEIMLQAIGFAAAKGVDECELYRALQAHLGD